jgi:hypothetical protein
MGRKALYGSPQIRISFPARKEDAEAFFAMAKNLCSTHEKCFHRLLMLGMDKEAVSLPARPDDDADVHTWNEYRKALSSLTNALTKRLDSIPNFVASEWGQKGSNFYRLSATHAEMTLGELSRTTTKLKNEPEEYAYVAYLHGYNELFPGNPHILQVSSDPHILHLGAPQTLPEAAKLLDGKLKSLGYCFLPEAQECPCPR